MFPQLTDHAFPEKSFGLCKKRPVYPEKFEKRYFYG